ncbi:MAG: hypothetical protein J4O01_05870 [Chloroflexi bacterium]|nr:hypothetical protein [Chloroflexota bacterium]MCI0775804.1 hypothetical protein [Chloroflexota bacterium]MCI0804723.1 hypothetical protein [Chloroflexota bacterium]MCI0834718.1 hypothetical protein [Chloroflexota bacterium]MCI0835993.1 hypothetical protein [Chloroflexota bacterium]
MSERNTQTNFLSERHSRRNSSAATVVYLRSAWYWPPFSGSGYTGGLFIYGRSYRS